MPLSIHAMSVGTFVPTLRTLSELLDKGAAFAEARQQDPAALLEARLSPDMFSLSRQVKLACEHASNGAELLLGRPAAPRNRDELRTIEALKALLAQTVAHLEALPVAAFDGAEDRDIELPLQDPMVLRMKGGELLRVWTLPNFYFHLVTAYDILRNAGVDLGKRDFMSFARSFIVPRGS